LWLVVFTFLATVAIGVVLTIVQPNKYTAVASVLLNFGTQNPFDDGHSTPAMTPQLGDSFMATQVNIINSKNVLDGVIDRLGVAKTPDDKATWEDTLSSNVDVEVADRDSRVVTISYPGDDPKFVAQVANAFAESYIATAQQLAAEPAKRNTEWFDSQLDKMRARLEKAQAALTDAQQKKGIVALDEKLDMETARLNELTNQLVQAQSDLYDARTRQLGVNHPDYRHAVARETTVEQSLAQQKDRVLALKEQRDELGMLSSQVTVEQSAYDNALQAYYSQQMQSSLAPTSVELLDRAAPPTDPSSPIVWLNIAGSVLLGLILAGLAAVGAELMFRRVRSSDDVAGLLESKVLSNV